MASFVMFKNSSIKDLSRGLKVNTFMRLAPARNFRETGAHVWKTSPVWNSSKTWAQMLPWNVSCLDACSKLRTVGHDPYFQDWGTWHQGTANSSNRATELRSYWAPSTLRTLQAAHVLHSDHCLQRTYHSPLHAFAPSTPSLGVTGLCVFTSPTWLLTT